MKYTKSILGIAMAALLFISCENNNVEDIENNENLISELSEDLTQEDLTSIIETINLNYPITVINDDDTKETISSDEGLENFSKKSKKPRVEFPVQISVNGETITINSPKEIKQFIKNRAHKKPRFKIVFPITVINNDGTTTDIANREAMKAYKETLEEGVRPAFQFPISIEKKDGTTLLIASLEDLKAHIKGSKKRKGKKQDAKKPPFKIVFPVTIINADESTTEILDLEAFKAYKETLEEGTKPTFQFPISIEKKDGTTLLIGSLEDLKARIKGNKPPKRK